MRWKFDLLQIFPHILLLPVLIGTHCSALPQHFSSSTLSLYAFGDIVSNYSAEGRSSLKEIRIGAGQGFWGDSLEAPVDLIRHGKINYLVLDYLAELTMSILAKQRRSDLSRGYAHDFVRLIDRTHPEIIKNGIKVIANAGGVNPTGCAQALKEHIRRHPPLRHAKIAVIEGDDILERLENLIASGVSFANLDTGEDLDLIRQDIVSANAYIGAQPIVEALANNADIVITGRVADAALPLAALRHELGWGPNDWDNLALGTIAGHIVECGAQCTGGNCSADWMSIPDLAGIGYPIIEVSSGDDLLITKAENSGGRVSLATIKEQLVYEIGDPRSYITPDVIADFTSINLTQPANNQVKISGAKGTSHTDFFKVSISYAAGFKAEGTLIYTWPDAVKKAQSADTILRERFERLGLRLDHVHSEILGTGACHYGMAATDCSDIPEVVFRIAARGKEKSAIERFSREITPLVLNGPPGATGYAGNRPHVQEIFGFWPALVPRELVPTKVTYLE